MKRHCLKKAVCMIIAAALALGTCTAAFAATGLKESISGGWLHWISEINGTVSKTEDGWRYTKNGKEIPSYTGIASNRYGTWYVKDGKVDLSYNGFAKTDKGRWYVKNGKVQDNYTGVSDFKDGDTWRYIKNGKVSYGTDTVAKNAYGWWVVRDGKVDLTYTGLAANGYGVWYCKNGEVIFSANGEKRIGDILYRVQNGKVTVAASGVITGGSDTTRPAANKALCKVPANIIARFERGDGQIKFVNDYRLSVFTDDGSSGKILGYDIELKNGAFGTDISVTHEFGHFTDFCAGGYRLDGKYSDKKRFEEIMQKEIRSYRWAFRDKNMDTSLNKNPATSEYFADAFSMYCRYPDDLKAVCPLTYAFIEETVEKI